MNKSRYVSAINNGTVIDHIQPGQTLRIIKMLGLLDKQYKVTIGLNMSSKQMKLKDLIKIENHLLTNEEANEITVCAPKATINIIKNFEVVEKIITRLPERVIGVFVCLNQKCITHVEPIESVFAIKEQGKQVMLFCEYCEKWFDRNQMKVKL